jgi:hypothetical protein
VREDYLLLNSLEHGATLGDAIEAAFVDSTIVEADRPAHIQSVFHYLMQMGWLCTPHAQEPV